MDSSSQVARHTYAEPGIYRVCLRVTNLYTGQTDISCQDVETTGIHKKTGLKENVAMQLKIYPNPAKDLCYIYYEKAFDGGIDIAIYDGAGRRLQTLASHRNQIKGEYTLTVNTTGFEKGIYFVRFNTGEKSFTEPLIIQR
jgi:hypothetical protein